jgi:hypothetical protein
MRAKVPVFLVIVGGSHVHAGDKIRSRTDGGICPGPGLAALSSVVDGGVADAGDDCLLLAGAGP